MQEDKKTKLVKVSEAAKILNVSVTTIRNYFHEGLIEGYQAKQYKGVMVNPDSLKIGKVVKN